MDTQTQTYTHKMGGGNSSTQDIQKDAEKDTEKQNNKENKLQHRKTSLNPGSGYP